MASWARSKGRIGRNGDQGSKDGSLGLCKCVTTIWAAARQRPVRRRAVRVRHKRGLARRGNSMMRPRGWGKATAWWICGARVQGCGHRVSVLEWWVAKKGYALASMQPGKGQAKVCRWFRGTGVPAARRGQGGQAVLVRCACVGAGGVR